MHHGYGPWEQFPCLADDHQGMAGGVASQAQRSIWFLIKPSTQFLSYLLLLSGAGRLRHS